MASAIVQKYCRPIDAARLIGCHPETIRRACQRDVFTIGVRRARGVRYRLYLDEVDAYAIGGDDEVRRLRATEGRLPKKR